MARAVPVTWRDEVEHRRLIADGINGAIDGRTNNVGAFTLTASTTTTAVTDKRAGGDSIITWMPTTATAAAAMDALYVSARGKETFTLTHDSAADTDRDFSYSLSGTGRGT